MRVVVKNLAASKLVKKFAEFYISRNFIAVVKTLTNGLYSKPTESSRHISTIS